MFFAAFALEFVFLAIVLGILTIKKKQAVIPSLAHGFRQYGVRLPAVPSRSRPTGLARSDSRRDSRSPGIARAPVLPVSTRARVLAREVSLGLVVAEGMFFLGDLVQLASRAVTVAILGEDYYRAASAGAINTSPPTLARGQVVLAIALMFAIVGSCEELFFRGCLVTEFDLGPAARVLASSALFGLYHVPPFLVPAATTLTFLPYYFVMGLVLGTLFLWRERTLMAPVAAHGAYNAILLGLRFW